MFVKKNRFSELHEFTRFFFGYIHTRLQDAGARFEGFKDIIVSLLVVKRGKYSSSFLNTSFFLFVGASLIAGPIIVENNPFIAGYFKEGTDIATQQVLASDIYSMSFQTQFSHKPRATIEEYEIKPGDTLASIASKFDISVDTIKWQNNLKNDTIKPGDRLEILPQTGIAHKVKSGESIYSIAKRYRVDAQNIVNFPFNEFEDLDTFALSVGQTLIVPGGVPPAAPVIARGPGVSRASVVAGVAGNGRFIWPTTGYISQYPVSYHMALDIANRALPAVIASDGGTVVFSGCIGYGYGCHVIIDHGNGFSSLYAHLSRIDAQAGAVVSQGQKIGNVGSTGRSTGPHLHFEIRSGGVLQNPTAYLK